MVIFLVFALLISLVAVIFAVQNTTMVTVSFLMWDFNNSLAVLILLTIFTGVLISILMSLPGWIKNRMRLMSMRKRYKELEQKLAKEEEKLLAAQLEVEQLKALITDAIANANGSGPTTAQSTSTVTSAPSAAVATQDSAPFRPTGTTPAVSEDSEMPELDNLYANESAQSVEETPIKKSKFPGIDRILNR